MSQSPISRAAAPIALGAGALVVITRLVIALTTPPDAQALKAYVLTPAHAINTFVSSFDGHTAVGHRVSVRRSRIVARTSRTAAYAAKTPTSGRMSGRPPSRRTISAMARLAHA